MIAMAGAFGFRARMMHLPRAVITRHIGGRPLGAPGDAERQHLVIQAALDLLHSAAANGAVKEMAEPYRAAP